MKNGNDENTPILVLKTHVQDFIEKRNWQKYHNPKDLAIAVCIEAAELCDIYKWRKITVEEAKTKDMFEKAEGELADIMIYVLHMCNVLSIDLTKAVTQKLKKNEEKYPIGEPLRW